MSNQGTEEEEEEEEERVWYTKLRSCSSRQPFRPMSLLLTLRKTPRESAKMGP